jgi:hypothetical protein
LTLSDTSDSSIGSLLVLLLNNCVTLGNVLGNKVVECHLSKQGVQGNIWKLGVFRVNQNGSTNRQLNAGVFRLIYSLSVAVDLDEVEEEGGLSAVLLPDVPWFNDYDYEGGGERAKSTATHITTKLTHPFAGAGLLGVGRRLRLVCFCVNYIHTSTTTPAATPQTSKSTTNSSSSIPEHTATMSNPTTNFTPLTLPSCTSHTLLCAARTLSFLINGGQKLAPPRFPHYFAYSFTTLSASSCCLQMVDDTDTHHTTHDTHLEDDDGNELDDHVGERASEPFGRREYSRLGVTVDLVICHFFCLVSLDVQMTCFELSETSPPRTK